MRGEVFPVLFPDLDSSHLVETGKTCSKTSPEYFIQGFEEPKPPRGMVENWKCQCGHTRTLFEANRRGKAEVHGYNEALWNDHVASSTSRRHAEEVGTRASVIIAHPVLCSASLRAIVDAVACTSRGGVGAGQGAHTIRCSSSHVYLRKPSPATVISPRLTQESSNGAGKSWPICHERDYKSCMQAKGWWDNQLSLRKPWIKELRKQNRALSPGSCNYAPRSIKHN